MRHAQVGNTRYEDLLERNATVSIWGSYPGIVIRLGVWQKPDDLAYAQSMRKGPT